MQQQVPPLALLISSLAYFYNSVNDVVPPVFRGPLRSGLILDRSTILSETTYGSLKGLKEVSRNGRRYFSFRAPPVHNLRFEPPEPPQSWSKVRDATRYGAECLQMNIITRMTISGNEDCLFLNVFTHRISSRKGRSQLHKRQLDPVIVFIHGGIFMSGGSNIYRPKYFMDEDVVLVTLNYRLASFGFLNTGDGVIAGNMGLKDQTMALRWVSENIAQFGGDPGRVTLMGESAGAAAVHCHMLSPLSKGLFHRAISMSGTAISPWALIENPHLQAMEFANDLDCPTDNITMMVACLKSLDANRITRVHFGYINNLANNKRSVYGPTVESAIKNAFLPAEPIHLLKAGKIPSSVPWMTGVNSEEGLVYLIPIIRNATMNRLVNSGWDQMAAKFLNLHPSEVNPTLLKDIKQFYLNNSEINLQTIKMSANMISDRAFFLDNHDAAVLHSRVANVYPYYYTYSGRYAMAKLLFVKSQLPFRLPDRYDFAIGTLSSWFLEYVLRIKEPNYVGIGHSDEMVLFFNTPFIRREIVPEDEDYVFSKALISLWVTFAETGVPNTKILHIPPWNPIRNVASGNHTLSRYHLDIEPRMGQEPFFERLKFWKARNISYIN
ncbi:venom carboxylesterase-6 isoform X2 [Folsomia candida]|uniref:venom carboxylesterase-6 isoform X2 n=1 Tax=Folsomia candida TaxID=158441 RepID=UPI001604F261|nr:venom carboxylesterase-6 isoform X2 [Folsomia candida]